MSPSLASASFELLSVNPPADDHSVVTAAVPAAATTTVCVTGAGGFIASWLVKLLLERGYNVRGTVRDPNDPKNAHLRALEGAADRLTLCKADLLDYQSLRTAIESCDGVFHTACPVGPDDPKMVGPTVKGTKNVLEAAAAAAGVSRVVFTSSIGAVYMAQNHDPNIMLDETSWSDIEYCRNTKNWYCYAKTIAERAAWEVADERGLKLVVVNPVLVVGPLLQPTLNASTAHLMKYLTGSAKTYANAVQVYVDVRDVAAAHVAVYEAPSAEGRYICAESKLHRGELVCILAELFPEYPIPTRCSDEVNPWRKGYEFTTKRLKDLGLKFTPIQQCLYDTVKSLQDKGHLD